VYLSIQILVLYLNSLDKSQINGVKPMIFFKLLQALSLALFLQQLYSRDY